MQKFRVPSEFQVTVHAGDMIGVHTSNYNNVSLMYEEAHRDQSPRLNHNYLGLADLFPKRDDNLDEIIRTEKIYIGKRKAVSLRVTGKLYTHLA